MANVVGEVRISEFEQRGIVIMQNRLIRCFNAIVRAAAALAVTVFCSASAPGAEPSTAPTTKAATSAFISELGKETFETSEPPAVSPVFRWDFSKAASQNYSYSQEVLSVTDFAQARGEELRKSRDALAASGSLTIRTSGDGTGEFLLMNIKSQSKVIINGVQSPPQEMPPFIVQGVREDGTGNFGGGSQDLMLRLLFPLPNKSLAVGESVELPMQMPFNLGESVLPVTGICRVRLVRYVTIENRTCAELKAEMDVSKMKVPAEIEGTYSASLTGQSVMYFDVSRKIFQSATVAAVMEMNVDGLPLVNNAFPPNQARQRSTRMTASNDNLIKVRLVE